MCMHCAWQVFFSAHGVPVSYVQQDGDPYKEEMEQCVDLIMQRLRERGVFNRHTLAYQSRVGPVSPPGAVSCIQLAVIFGYIPPLPPHTPSSSQCW